MNRRYKMARTSVLLRDGNVLVTSGATAAEVLDVARGAFREVAGRLTGAYRFAAAAPLPGGDVLITGGYSDANPEHGRCVAISATLTCHLTKGWFPTLGQLALALGFELHNFRTAAAAPAAGFG